MSKLHDIVIVGSGPAGVGAALGLVENRKKPLILDVGHRPEPPPPLDENFYDFRKERDVFDIMIGQNFEGLSNIFNRTSLSPRLTSPLMQYVTRDADRLSPVQENGFKTVQSFAMGGLASAWGAGLFRYTDRELGGMPISAAELEPYYDKLTQEIGIIGCDDDLTPYFGTGRYLLKPLRFSEKSGTLYRRYQRRKKRLKRQGIFMGHPRLGVLSEDYHGRSAAARYDNGDSWIPNLPYVYNPAFTLERLIRQDKVIYQKGFLVTGWQRQAGGIAVQARDLENDRPVTFKTRKLILAAGTINTARIVLEAGKAYDTPLPLLDNPLVQVPLIFPGFFGKRLEKEAFGMGHISMVFDLKPYDVLAQGGILELTSPARAAFYDQFPFPASHNIRLIRLTANAVLVMFLFFPSCRENAASLRLTPGGILRLECPPYRLDKRIIRLIAGAFRRLGVLCSARFIQYSPPGYGIHYAGTIPMKEKPDRPYQCDRYGELFGEPGVHLVDGSVLPEIAAKNLSLTIMANAMRTADALCRRHPQKL